MKSVLSLIAVIIFVATSGPISKNIYNQVRIESLKKVDQGLVPLLIFSAKLNKK